MRFLNPLEMLPRLTGRTWARSECRVLLKPLAERMGRRCGAVLSLFRGYGAQREV